MLSLAEEYIVVVSFGAILQICTAQKYSEVSVCLCHAFAYAALAASVWRAGDDLVVYGNCEDFVCYFSTPFEKLR